MKEQQELWAQFITSAECASEDDILHNHHNCPPETDNVQSEESLHPLKKRMFNTETKLWEFGGLSTHSPSPQPVNETLSRCRQQRLQITDWTTTRDRDGFLIGPDLVPKLPDTCDCGAGYANLAGQAEITESSFSTTIYMKHAPVRCQVMRVLCLARQCKLEYSGKQDCLHFWSRETVLGDEVGWDFILRVMNSRTSFSSFCNGYTQEYKSICTTSASFLSTTTFVSWFFSWAAAMKIDFRKDVDPWCPSRKIIAADGTHLGISLKQMRVSPVNQQKKTTKHRRYDRVFLFYREDIIDEDVRVSRSHLMALSKSDVEGLNAEEKISRDRLLIKCCSNDERCYKVMQNFCENVYPPPIFKSLGKVFQILAGNAPVSALLPLQHSATTLDVCRNMLLLDSGTDPAFQKVEAFSPEIGRLLKATYTSEWSTEIARFTMYLVEFAENIHVHDDPYPTPIPVSGSYNPESGTAYYFTQHGCRVRDIPQYTINDKSKRMHDDNPDNELCSKVYPKVSSGGFCHTFFFFCPIHGHCLGFHLIDSFEGRKDAITPLYAYKPEPPAAFFYDFACGANEYGLNREPAFFKKTRFFHDIFHSFTHKCPVSFRSSRIMELEAVDSEICEQFNAFLQNIKYTCSHFTQSHYCFFVQLMIHFWNRRKSDTVTSKLKIALRGNN